MAENLDYQTDNWNRGQTLELIREYQKYPCLYSPMDKNFVNKIKRNEKYNLILLKLKNLKPMVTIKAIKSKIRTLQSQLWKENQKIINSKRSGIGTDDVYEPSLWCYNELSFLQHCNDAEPSTSNINLSHIGIEDSETSQETNINNNTKKKRKTNKASLSQQLQADGLETLQMAKNFMEGRSERKPLTKEEVFCTYLCSELKKIMLEETFANLKLEILQLVNKRIFDEKRIFEDRNYFSPIFDHQTGTNINQPIRSSTPTSKTSQFSITSASTINYPQIIKPASCNFTPLPTNSNLRTSIPFPSSSNSPYSTNSTSPIDYLQITNSSSNFIPISSSPQYSPSIPSHIGSHIYTTNSSSLSISSSSKTTSASSINYPQKTNPILSNFTEFSNNPTYLSSAVQTAQKIKIPSYIKCHPSTPNSSPLSLSSLSSTTSTSPSNYPPIIKPVLSDFAPVSSTPPCPALPVQTYIGNIKNPSYIKTHHSSQSSPYNLHKQHPIIKSHPSTSNSSPLSLSSLSSATSTSPSNYPQIIKPVLSDFAPVSSTPPCPALPVQTYIGNVKNPSYIKTHHSSQSSPHNLQKQHPIILRNILIKSANKQPTPTKSLLQEAIDDVFEDYIIEDSEIILNN